MDDHQVPAEAMPSGDPPVTGEDAGLSPWRPPTGEAVVPPPFAPPPPPAPGPLWPGSSWGDGVGNGDQPWAPPPLVPAAVTLPATGEPPATFAPAADPTQPGVAAVGRASAPMVAPLPGVPVQRAAANTYRSGELPRDEEPEPDPNEDLSTTQPAPPPVVLAPTTSGELPRRREGAALAAEAPGLLPTRRPQVPAESTWSAFAQPWLEEPSQPSQGPAAQGRAAQGLPGTLPGTHQPGLEGFGVQRLGDAMPTNRVPDPPQPAASATPPPVTARARVGTQGQPASAAEVAALRRTAEPRVYRSGLAAPGHGADLAAAFHRADLPAASRWADLAGDAAEPGPTPEPPGPTPTPQPTPQRPEPGPTPMPSPGPSPQPPSPPGPPPPSPIPTPFPEPAPLPQPPPVPVPPEPPTPEPSPGPVPPSPPVPPTPPFPVPPAPVPPGPAPMPPFPGPPATTPESIAVPAASLPAWPPSTTPSPLHTSYSRPPFASATPPSPTMPAAPVAPTSPPASLTGAGEHPPAPGQPDYVERLPWRGPAAPEGAAAGSDRYGDWARAGRPQGTVYGGQPLPSPIPANIENSGSLTGHILAQGHPVVPRPSTGRSKFMIAVVVLVSLLVLAGVGYGVVVATHLLTH